MIYFRNYRVRVRFEVSRGQTVRDADGNILRGVTPVTAIVIMYNPLDMDLYANKAANGLTREEARRKAVFKTRRRLLEMVKSKKPCVAQLSDGSWRVTTTLAGGRITGYGSTPVLAVHNARVNYQEMNEVFDDIIERKQDTHVTKKWSFWDWFK